jgi:DMSO/TMAO reductase YedYZ molybdopterin-dependent catalytic subunit
MASNLAVRSGARRQLARDLFAGFVGGLAALVGDAIARTAFGTVILAQIAVDAASSILPTSWFGYLLDQLQRDAKPLLYSGVLAGELLAYVIIACLAATLARRAPEPLERAVRLCLAIGMALTAQVAAATLLVAFTDATPPPDGWAAYIGVAGGVSAAFGLGTEGFRLWFFTEPATREVPESGGRLISRRRLLRQGSGLAVVVLAGLFVSRVILDRFGSVVKSSRRGAPSPPVTNNDDFYKVTKNLFDPNITEGDWHLDVDGLVLRPLSLSLADIRARPANQTYNTFECISNQVAGNLISNALWTGIALRSLLEEAGVQPSARFLKFESVDGYTESLPLELALDQKVRLVYEMNGVPLPSGHGFPLRVVAPGKYGMKQPKWLRRITLIDKDELGYWEQRGWDEAARVKTMSRIDVPADGDVSSEGSTTLYGIAFSGDQGISRVEVSSDGGKTWNDASLSPPLSSWSWVLWNFDWFARRGDHQLVVRATDGNSAVQEAREQDTLPSGASGYHRVNVSVQPTLT